MALCRFDTTTGALLIDQVSSSAVLISIIISIVMDTTHMGFNR